MREENACLFKSKSCCCEICVASQSWSLKVRRGRVRLRLLWFLHVFISPSGHRKNQPHGPGTSGRCSWLPPATCHRRSRRCLTRAGRLQPSDCPSLDTETSVLWQREYLVGKNEIYFGWKGGTAVTLLPYSVRDPGQS